jgi:hypothetical protein
VSSDTQIYLINGSSRRATDSVLRIFCRPLSNHTRDSENNTREERATCDLDLYEGKREIISVLDELIETLKDGQKGFRQAAEGVSDPKLKSLFRDYSDQRSRFVTARDGGPQIRRKRAGQWQYRRRNEVYFFLLPRAIGPPSELFDKRTHFAYRSDLITSQD